MARDGRQVTAKRTTAGRRHARDVHRVRRHLRRTRPGRVAATSARRP